MFIRKPNSTLFTKCQRVVEWIVAEELAKKKKLELTEHVTSSREIIQEIFFVGINSLETDPKKSSHLYWAIFPKL